MFYPFIKDDSVRIIGVEAGGDGRFCMNDISSKVLKQEDIQLRSVLVHQGYYMVFDQDALLFIEKALEPILFKMTMVKSRKRIAFQLDLIIQELVQNILF